MKLLSIFSVLFLGVFLCNNLAAQNSIKDLNIDDYPEYIVVSVHNNTRGINSISINAKDSPNEEKFKQLSDILNKKKNMRIRNETDLLNTMYDFGYEYVDTFNGNASTGGPADVVASTTSFQSNLIFRKRK